MGIGGARAGRRVMIHIKVARNSRKHDVPRESGMNEHRIHQIFQISVFLKGVHAVIECAGGIAVALISKSTLIAAVKALTQQELTEDPNDFLAANLLTLAQSYSVGAKHFYAFYLLSHGVVKLFLVAGLLNDRLWSYPAALVVFGLFIVYQLFRYSYTHGLGLIVLTVFDVVVMGLIWHEYGLARRHPRAK